MYFIIAFSIVNNSVDKMNVIKYELIAIINIVMLYTYKL